MVCSQKKDFNQSFKHVNRKCKCQLVKQFLLTKRKIKGTHAVCLQQHVPINGLHMLFSEHTIYVFKKGYFQILNICFKWTEILYIICSNFN